MPARFGPAEQITQTKSRAGPPARSRRRAPRMGRPNSRARRIDQSTIHAISTTRATARNLLLFVLFGGLTACGQSLSDIACTEIFTYGVNVQVVDAVTSKALAAGATMTIKDGPYEEVVTDSFDGLTMSGAGERAGTYTITIERDGYQSWSVGGVVVTEDECHVIPVSLIARLQPT